MITHLIKSLCVWEHCDLSQTYGSTQILWRPVYCLCCICFSLKACLQIFLLYSEHKRNKNIIDEMVIYLFLLKICNHPLWGLHSASKIIFVLFLHLYHISLLLFPCLHLFLRLSASTSPNHLCCESLQPCCHRSVHCGLHATRGKSSFSIWISPLLADKGIVQSLRKGHSMQMKGEVEFEKGKTCSAFLFSSEKNTAMNRLLLESY